MDDGDRPARSTCRRSTGRRCGMRCRSVGPAARGARPRGGRHRAVTAHVGCGTRTWPGRRVRGGAGVDGRRRSPGAAGTCGAGDGFAAVHRRSGGDTDPVRRLDRAGRTGGGTGGLARIPRRGARPFGSPRRGRGTPDHPTRCVGRRGPGGRPAPVRQPLAASSDGCSRARRDRGAWAVVRVDDVRPRAAARGPDRSTR